MGPTSKGRGGEGREGEEGRVGKGRGGWVGGPPPFVKS